MGHERPAAAPFPCNHWTASVDSIPDATERTLFVAPFGAALDVYVTALNNPGVVNSLLRVYAIVDGAETLVQVNTVRLGHRGRVARVRGGADGWRVTIQSTDDNLQATPARFSYCAYGLEPSPDPVPDEGYLTAQIMRTWRTQSSANAPTTFLFGAAYLRQVFGNYHNAGAVWVQLWDYDQSVSGALPPGHVAGLVHELFLSSQGDNYNFDFRDPHRASFLNDGLKLDSGCTIALSTTPLVYNATANSFSYTTEWRQEGF